MLSILLLSQSDFNNASASLANEADVRLDVCKLNESTKDAIVNKFIMRANGRCPRAH